MFQLVINSSFTPNCLFKSSFGLGPFYGRDMLLQRYLSISKNIPNYYVLYSKPKIHHRCVSCKIYSYGSVSKNGVTDVGSHLWNPFHGVPEEKLTEQMLTLKKKVDTWIAANVPMRMVQITTAFFILNEEMTYFEARTSSVDSVEVFENLD